jgi:hypothetical protein
MRNTGYDNREGANTQGRIDRSLEELRPILDARKKIKRENKGLEDDLIVDGYSEEEALEMSPNEKDRKLLEWVNEFKITKPRVRDSTEKEAIDEMRKSGIAVFATDKPPREKKKLGGTRRRRHKKKGTRRL